MALVEFQTDNNLVSGRLRFKPLRQIASMFWRRLEGCIWSNRLSLIESEKDTTFRVGFTLLSGWPFGTKSGKDCICSDRSQMQKVGLTHRKHLDWGVYNWQRELVSPVLYWPASEDSHTTLILLVQDTLWLWDSAWLPQIQTCRAVSFIEMCSLRLQTF